MHYHLFEHTTSDGTAPHEASTEDSSVVFHTEEGAFEAYDQYVSMYRQWGFVGPQAGGAPLLSPDPEQAKRLALNTGRDGWFRHPSGDAMYIAAVRIDDDMHTPDCDFYLCENEDESDTPVVVDDDRTDMDALEADDPDYAALLDSWDELTARLIDRGFVITIQHPATERAVQIDQEREQARQTAIERLEEEGPFDPEAPYGRLFNEAIRETARLIGEYGDPREGKTDPLGAVPWDWRYELGKEFALEAEATEAEDEKALTDTEINVPEARHTPVQGYDRW